MSDETGEGKMDQQHSGATVSEAHLSELDGAATVSAAAVPPMSVDLTAARDLTAVPADLSLFRIPVQITAVIGRSILQVSELLKLQRGAIIELDSKVGGPIDIYVNNRRVARGDLLINEDRLSISMTEVLKIQDS